MESIQILGIKELAEPDQEMVKKLCDEYYEKITRIIKKDANIKVHIKTFEKEGARQRYELSITLDYPARRFEANKLTEQETWDLASVIHAGFKDLIHELQHHFKE